MKRELPARPSLEYLRKQAKDLLTAARAGDAEAQATLAEVTKSKSPRLHDAQLALAREYGFASWRDLANKVRTSQSDGFLETVCGDKGDPTKELPMPPEPIRLSNVYVAAASGDPTAIARHMVEDPSRATKRGGPKDWSPLLYLCFSLLNRKAPERFAEAARILLDHGADPNDFWEHPAYVNNPLPALFGACGHVHNVHLGRLLIERGAKVDDNESLYHSTESRNHDCLKLLLESGAKVEGSNALPRMLDHDDLEGLRLMLDSTVDVNHVSLGEAPLFHAIRRGRGVEHIRMLLERGADPGLKSKEGLNGYELALRHGNLEVARLLVEMGLFEPDAKAEFMTALLEGRDSDAFSVEDLGPEDLDVFAEVAWAGRLEAVEAMLRAGFPLDHRASSDGHTPLHAAVWPGNADVAEAILRYNPPLDVRDRTHTSTPFGWAVHGSRFAVDGDGSYLSRFADHPRVVQLLLEAGAPMEGDWSYAPDEVKRVIEEFEA